MTLELKKSDGRWTVNGKPYSQLNPTEAALLDDLIINARLETLGIKEEVKTAPDWGKILTENTKPCKI